MSADKRNEFSYTVYLREVMAKYKCSVENCEEVTDDFICPAHLTLIQTQHAHMKVCSKCLTIHELRAREPNEKQIDWVDKCDYCNYQEEK